MKNSAIRMYISDMLCKLEGELKTKYVRPEDFTGRINLTKDKIISALDKMTDEVERCYVLTCPDCYDEIATMKTIPVQPTVYTCPCGVKFELRLEHFSLVYKIIKTA